MRETNYRTPEEFAETPMSYTFKTPMFEYMRQNAEQLANFDGWMTSRREGRLRWQDIFPAGSVLSSSLTDDPESALLVDVGGNQGHDLFAFKQRNLDLPGRLVLQDLPETLARIKQPVDGIEIMPTTSSRLNLSKVLERTSSAPSATTGRTKVVANFCRTR